MSKLERLLNLTALLLETRRPIPVEEIGRTIEGYAADPVAFRRAFERDKDDLRELGIPVEVTPIDPGDPSTVGYRIPNDRYYLPDLALDPGELAALTLAVSLVRTGGAVDVDTFRKLGGAPAAVEGGDLPVEAELPAPEALTALFGALNDRCVVEFSYRGEVRRVEPRRLDYKGGRWYLSADDLDRQAARTFRLDRFDGPVTAGPPGGFEPTDDEAGLRLEPWRFGDAAAVDVEVRIDPAHVAVAERLVGTATAQRREADGSLVVTLAVTDEGALADFVLGLLDHAEILSPIDVRDRFVARLEALAHGAPA
ncbi:MAG: WYL domain-containing protein [Actinobacteria bacterium]|nr:WYL domain-containing protein [Actinomycetota bacterium]